MLNSLEYALYIKKIKKTILYLGCDISGSTLACITSRGNISMNINYSFLFAPRDIQILHSIILGLRNINLKGISIIHGSLPNEAITLLESKSLFLQTFNSMLSSYFLTFEISTSADSYLNRASSLCQLFNHNHWKFNPILLSHILLTPLEKCYG